ncbi:MAG: hypothetical protein AAB111_09610, partial [Nitrospirota bacterium]
MTWEAVPRHSRHLAAGVLLGLAAIIAGCDRSPGDAVAVKTPVAASTPGLITLSAEESARIGLVVQPASRTDFRTYRDFPAILQPNERAMADITTLVRGRVVDVYADLGQQVEANALLA